MFHFWKITYRDLLMHVFNYMLKRVSLSLIRKNILVSLSITRMRLFYTFVRLFNCIKFYMTLSSNRCTALLCMLTSIQRYKEPICPKWNYLKYIQSLALIVKNVFQTLFRTLDYVIKPNLLIALLLRRRDYQKPSVMLCPLSPFWHTRLSSSALPTHSQWLPDLMSCLKLEKIWHSIRGSEKNHFLHTFKAWRYDGAIARWGPALDFQHRHTYFFTVLLLKPLPYIHVFLMSLTASRNGDGLGWSVILLLLYCICFKTNKKESEREI